MVSLKIISSSLLGGSVLPAPTTRGSMALKVLVGTIEHRKHPTVLSTMTSTWNIGLVTFMYQWARKRKNTVGSRVKHWDLSAMPLLNFKWTHSQGLRRCHKGEDLSQTTKKATYTSTDAC